MGILDFFKRERQKSESYGVPEVSSSTPKPVVPPEPKTLNAYSSASYALYKGSYAYNSFAKLDKKDPLYGGDVVKTVEMYHSRLKGLNVVGTEITDEENIKLIALAEGSHPKYSFRKSIGFHTTENMRVISESFGYWFEMDKIHPFCTSIPFSDASTHGTEWFYDIVEDFGHIFGAEAFPTDMYFKYRHSYSQIDTYILRRLLALSLVDQLVIRGTDKDVNLEGLVTVNSETKEIGYIFDIDGDKVPLDQLIFYRYNSTPENEKRVEETAEFDEFMMKHFKTVQEAVKNLEARNGNTLFSVETYYNIEFTKVMLDNLSDKGLKSQAEKFNKVYSLYIDQIKTLKELIVFISTKPGSINSNTKERLGDSLEELNSTLSDAFFEIGMEIHEEIKDLANSKNLLVGSSVEELDNILSKLDN